MPEVPLREIPDLDHVERRIWEMWSEVARDGKTVLRACKMNLVVVSAPDDDLGHLLEDLGCPLGITLDVEGLSLEQRGLHLRRRALQGCREVGQGAITVADREKSEPPSLQSLEPRAEEVLLSFRLEADQVSVRPGRELPVSADQRPVSALWPCA